MIPVDQCEIKLPSSLDDSLFGMIWSEADDAEQHIRTLFGHASDNDGCIVFIERLNSGGMRFIKVFYRHKSKKRGSSFARMKGANFTARRVFLTLRNSGNAATSLQDQ